ncbi:hypothetical protein GOP47_0005012 [Adiantum capillus-veneris]|uniref:Complex III subunit VII n=1 Tax=Adiantum capillus-veneris TaxID=13818 RepID=A0A9D4V5F0_ADICA|nr:hypothetical protein GOP47_0005012 [Adiantum capillus-veneris]
MAKFISRTFDKVLTWMSEKYRADISRRLTAYGLRYDDLYDDSHDLDVKEALARLPQSVVDARNQRIKRAMDLSMKHSHLPKELQEKQTPLEPYLQDMLSLVKAERKERETLGSDVPYNRTLP